jgi:hypothetical protein
VASFVASVKDVRKNKLTKTITHIRGGQLYLAAGHIGS